jgi:hypothetical protein
MRAGGAARDAYLAGLDEKARARWLRKLEAPVSGAAAARRALVQEYSAVARWLVRCALCGREGYKPSMPQEIDRRGTAAQVRRLFRPLSVVNYVCDRCQARVDKATAKAEALHLQRRR